MYKELSGVWIMAYTTIDDPSVYFQTTLYAGDGSSSNAITNAGNSDLQPDWIWGSLRDEDGGARFVFDSSRGVTNRLKTNAETEEQVRSGVTAFNSDGFTVGSHSDSNLNAKSLVAWQWKANGGTTSSFTESGNNPGGTIQTNTTAGFSIITTTGTGGAGTISHGLGAVPHWIISKCRSHGSTGWGVYHQKNTSEPETELLGLASTGATLDSSSYYNDTAPTSSVFTVGTSNDINGDGRTYIFYVFTEIQGYSKFGSYTGNGNADGPFVYTGFKPAWIMIKRTDSADDWKINDVARDFNGTYGNDASLHANDSTVETTSASFNVDFLSNGFKLRSADAGNNASGGTYIYMTFAEHPFVSSKGVPTTAK
jgi:hypothetical protein